jgi:hypothetical protein
VICYHIPDFEDVVPPIVDKQRLSEHVPVTTNAHATIEELLDAVFSMRSVSYKYSICGERKAGD